MAPIYCSTVNKLPTTTHIKMIDYWNILSLLKPLVDLIFHTYIENLRDELIDVCKNEQGSKQA